MTQAAATGALDFSEADFYDRRWWIKRNWIIDYLTTMNDVKLYEYQLAQMNALLQASPDPSKVSDLLDKIQAAHNSLLEALEPWVDHGPTSLYDVAKSMRKQYAARFGDPESPEFKAEQAALLAYWKDIRNGGQPRL